MLRILNFIGTRPEVIKMGPVIAEQKKQKDKIESLVCATAQHRELLDQALDIFSVIPNYDLDLMQKNQKLPMFVGQALESITKVLQQVKPDVVLVQGDTSTAFIASLASYYEKIPIGHVEAGLRTFDIYNPFPEEVNRRLIGTIASIHFAPTLKARENLLKEGVDPHKIFLIGNTIVDALMSITSKFVAEKEERNNNKTILVTAHRRENFGKPLENICQALKELVLRNKDIEIIYPVHPNPRVKETISIYLKNTRRIELIEPVDYLNFVKLMYKSYLILTDSGGIQEEAPILGKPVLILRKVTERPEAVEGGSALLVGTEKDKIVFWTEKLLRDEALYKSMSQSRYIFGDGKAAERMVGILLNHFENKKPPFIFKEANKILLNQ